MYWLACGAHFEPCESLRVVGGAMIQGFRVRKGSAVLVSGCLVVFVSLSSNSDGCGRVLRVRGDFGPMFSGCVDSLGIWRDGRFFVVDLEGIVSVVLV